MRELNSKQSTLIEIVLYLVFFIIALAIPLIFGLSLKGFEESFIQGKGIEFGSYLANFLTYIPFLIIGILCIIFPIMRENFIGRTEHPATKPNPKWWRIFTVSMIYSPEDGLLYKLSPKYFQWLKNPMRVLWYSILFFGLFGLLVIFQPQLAVTSGGQVALQQVTAGTEVSFNALVPSIAENGTLFAILSLFMGLVAFLVAKSKTRNIWAYFTGGFFVSILMGLIWMSFHFIAKGNSEAGLIGTFIFGFAGSFITIITGIFIPWVIWHFMNNGSLSLLDVVNSNENLKLVATLVWIVLVVLTIIVGVQKKKNKKVVNGIPA